MAQKADLRVVLRRGAEYGWVWYARLQGFDVYANTPDHPVLSSRISYHASGAGHIYVSRAGHKIIAPPSQPMAGLKGKERVGGWSHHLTAWGYSLKADTTRRKTLVLEEPYPRPLSVDLWLLEERRPELAESVLVDYNNVRVLARLHVSNTSPQLFAVVYTMTGPVVDDLLRQTEHEQKRGYLS